MSRPVRRSRSGESATAASRSGTSPSVPSASSAREAQLDGVAAQAGQPLGIGEQERLVTQLAERGTTPDRERLGGQLHGPRRVAISRRAGGRDQLDEPVGVHLTARRSMRYPSFVRTITSGAPPSARMPRSRLTATRKAASDLCRPSHTSWRSCHGPTGALSATSSRKSRACCRTPGRATSRSPTSSTTGPSTRITNVPPATGACYRRLVPSHGRLACRRAWRTTEPGRSRGRSWAGFATASCGSGLRCRVAVQMSCDAAASRGQLREVDDLGVGAVGERQAGDGSVAYGQVGHHTHRYAWPLLRSRWSAPSRRASPPSLSTTNPRFLVRQMYAMFAQRSEPGSRPNDCPTYDTGSRCTARWMPSGRLLTPSGWWYVD